jgi:hypothetical protein
LTGRSVTKDTTPSRRSTQTKVIRRDPFGPTNSASTVYPIAPSGFRLSMLATRPLVAARMAACRSSGDSRPNARNNPVLSPRLCGARRYCNLASLISVDSEIGIRSGNSARSPAIRYSNQHRHRAPCSLDRRSATESRSDASPSRPPPSSRRSGRRSPAPNAPRRTRGSPSAPLGLEVRPTCSLGIEPGPGRQSLRPRHRAGTGRTPRPK